MDQLRQKRRNCCQSGLLPRTVLTYSTSSPVFVTVGMPTPLVKGVTLKEQKAYKTMSKAEKESAKDVCFKNIETAGDMGIVTMHYKTALPKAKEEGWADEMTALCAVRRDELEG